MSGDAGAFRCSRCEGITYTWVDPLRRRAPRDLVWDPGITYRCPFCGEEGHFAAAHPFASSAPVMEAPPRGHTVVVLDERTGLQADFCPVNNPASARYVPPPPAFE
ncbi:hypothetical protein [Streptosporangium sp. NPDC002524]|uniref:hypothetical protein n=1 Tax=Streptosporangium sp. NPDC002524 TaxID=3154537 RepID=UPI00332C3B8A